MIGFTSASNLQYSDKFMLLIFLFDINLSQNPDVNIKNNVLYRLVFSFTQQSHFAQYCVLHNQAITINFHELC